MTKIRICLAGAAGWAGSALSRGIFEAPDMELVAAISRSHAGQVLGEAIDIKGLTTPVFATATEALKTKPDVFVEYTKPDVAKFHILSALRSGAHVVVGTSGLRPCRKITFPFCTRLCAARWCSSSAVRRDAAPG